MILCVRGLGDLGTNNMRKQWSYNGYWGITKVVMQMLSIKNKFHLKPALYKISVKPAKTIGCLCNVEIMGVNT